MRVGWQISKLGTLCSVRRDSGIHNDMNYIGLEHISSGTGCLISVSDTSGVIGTTNLFREGDVLYGKLRPYLKKVVVADFEGCCSSEILPIRCGDSILPHFLKYWFLEDGITDRINATCGGCRMPRANMRDVFGLEFAFPSLLEQQRIVDILDQEFAKIDTLKANAEKSIQLAKDLFQATLKKELKPKEGWTYMRLNDLYNFIDYRGSTPTKLTEGIPLVTAKNIKMGFLDYSIKDFISQEEYNHRQSRGISQRGDILFTTEAPLGNVAIADKDVFSAGQRVITFQQYPHATIELNNRFYLYYFLSSMFQETLKEQATGATAQGIKASRLKEIQVPFVGGSVQNSIVRRLDDLNDMCHSLQENYQKTLALCDDLKQSLLRKAFNGEL